MACNCSKRKASAPVTGFAVQTRPPKQEEPTPYRLTRDDGSTQDFPNRLAAYAAQITERGGTISPISAS